MPSAMVSQSPLRVPYAMRNAGSTAGETDVLAGEPGTQYVDRLDLVPVDPADVAEIRYARMVCGQDGTHVAIVVGDPGKDGAQESLYSHVQAAVARAEGAKTEKALLVWSCALTRRRLEAILSFTRVLHILSPRLQLISVSDQPRRGTYSRFRLSSSVG